MSRARPFRADTARSQTRALMAALVLSLGLLGWRALAILDPVEQPASGPSANPAEYVLEPFTGAGHVRVVREGTPASTLVLLDTASAGTAALSTERIGSLLTAAGLHAPLAGETLAVQRTPFPGYGTPMVTPAAALELAGLGALALLLAWLSLQSVRRVDGAAQPASRIDPSETAGRVPATPRAPTADPEQLAALMRTWIREDAA